MQSTNYPQPDARKVIAIYCNEIVLGGDPFSSEYYWEAYQDLMLALEKRGLIVYLVSDNDSYQGNGRFEVAYSINGKCALDKLIKHRNVTVNMVFNRGDFRGTDVFVINDPYVQTIGMDKTKMYEHFAALQPKSHVCYNRQDVEAAVHSIPGEEVVIKVPTGYGGKDVHIGKKSDVLARAPTSYPLLVQEFLDTSEGVPGYIEGVHDVRLSICGGEIIGCYIRVAKPGSMHSNVSQGGKMFFWDVSRTPAGAAKLAMEVDKIFKDYPRYYAADFIYTKSGWKLLEINPLLALLPVTDGPEAIITLRKLADYLAAQVDATQSTAQ